MQLFVKVVCCLETYIILLIAWCRRCVRVVQMGFLNLAIDDDRMSSVKRIMVMDNLDPRTPFVWDQGWVMEEFSFSPLQIELTLGRSFCLALL